jgi:hypothetical protein
VCEKDEREATNVAVEHPDVVKRLTLEIEAFGKQMIAAKRQAWTSEPMP